MIPSTDKLSVLTLHLAKQRSLAVDRLSLTVIEEKEKVKSVMTKPAHVINYFNDFNYELYVASKYLIEFTDNFTRQLDTQPDVDIILNNFRNNVRSNVLHFKESTDAVANFSSLVRNRQLQRFIDEVESFLK